MAFSVGSLQAKVTEMQTEMDKLQGHRRTALVLHAKVQQLTRQLAERQATTPPKPRKNGGGGGSPPEKRRAGSASPTAVRTAVPLATRALFQPIPPRQPSAPPAVVTTPPEAGRPDADVLYIASEDEGVRPVTAVAAVAAEAVSAAATHQLQCTETFQHAQMFDALQWH